MSAVAAGTDLNAAAGGNVPDDYEAAFYLDCTFGSAPSAGKRVELYLIPKVDGTNLPTVDLTAGASVLPRAFYRGSFEVCLSQTGQKLAIEGVPLSALLYTVYLLNKADADISANWTLKAVTSRDQYT